MKTVSFTTQNAGALRVEIPGGAFFVSQIREMGPPKSRLIAPDVKGRAVFGPLPGPWTYNILAAGDQLQIDVTFQPKWDMSTMNAGPKSASMKVSGPGVTVPWTFSVPLAGMFNGKHTMPLVTLPEKDFLITNSMNVVVHLVGAGDETKGRLVWSLPAGVTVDWGSPTDLTLGGAESKDLTYKFSAASPQPEGTHVQGSVRYEFTRKGESVKQQTAPIAFAMTYIPMSFDKPLAEKICGLRLSNPRIYVNAGGRIYLQGNLTGGGSDGHFEVYFPQAGRTLMHTNVPWDLNKDMITSRVEESGPMVYIRAISMAITVDGNLNPGPPNKLDRYLALLHSTAELRCW